MNDTICVILAGGKSRRMGRDKAMLSLGNGTFLSHLVDTYSPEFPVYVSVAEPGRIPLFGAKEIPDIRPGKGPLAGLEASFVQTGAERIFLTATDLPFGTPALAKELIARIGDCDACVIRRVSGKAEPAFGVYALSCLPHIRTMLDEGHYAMGGLLDRIRVRWVEESELMEFDLGRILSNINTPESYHDAMRRCGVTTEQL